MARPEEHIDDLLVKYLDGEASVEEQAEVESWLKQPENKARFDTLMRIHERVARLHGIDPLDVDTDTAWKKVAGITVNKGKIRQLPARSNRNLWLRVAAVILVVAGVALWLGRQGEDATLPMAEEVPTKVEEALPQTNSTTADAAIQELKLADGSVVTLRKNTKLSYPDQFTGSSREVALEGEAFFDIAKDPEKPFIIRSGHARVKVLGTSFLVRSDEQRGVEVFVKTGRVSLSKVETPDASETEEVILTEGEHGLLPPDAEEPAKVESDELNYLAWMDSVLRFKDTPLIAVLADLEELYGVHFEVNEKTLSGCTITARFEHSPLEDILETMKIYFQWEIQQTDHTVIIHGNGCQ